MHAVDRNLEVAKFVGAECAVREFWLPSRDEDREIADGWLRAGGIVDTDRLVAMAPV